MPEISVIVINWNGEHFLEDCLVALRRQTFRDFETILVDNGSRDGSLDYVRSQFPEVQIVALPQNLGFAGGNIAGYKRASADLIALLNNDTEAHPEWLEEFHKASRCYPNAGSFASKMMYFDDRERIENCGSAIGSDGATMNLGRDERDGPAWAQPRSIFGPCAGAVAYRRQMLADIGFLDPEFVNTYEDADLSFRAQLRGYECVFVPRAVVYHHYCATNKKTPARQVFNSQRNIEFVYLKNMPLSLILRYAPQRLLYEIGAALYFTRTGFAAAFVRAKLDVLKHLPSLLRKRKEIQARKTVPNSYLRALMTDSVLASRWKKLRSAWHMPAQSPI